MIRFLKFGKKREPRIIVSTDDARLVQIDPTSEVFFEKILEYVTESEDIKNFIEVIKEVKEKGLIPFWKPIFDPSLDGEEVVFKARSTPAIGHSYKWWVDTVKAMPAVENANWNIGTEYEYYAFLVYLINSLVKNGWEIRKALGAVVLNSRELGHYWNSENALHELEKTGSREVCGFYDLANTHKMLSFANEKYCYAGASGSYYDYSVDYPVAALTRNANMSGNFYNSVGWLVLK